MGRTTDFSEFFLNINVINAAFKNITFVKTNREFDAIVCCAGERVRVT